MSRLLRFAAGAALFAGAACKVSTVPPGGEDPGGGGGDALPEKGLRVDGCPGGDGVLALSGAWAFRFEAASTVTGASSAAQAEVATRYGVALLCQDGPEVGAYMVVCAISQSRLEDASGDCAAQLPSSRLVASLPIAGAGGTLDLDAPGGRLRLEGWTEDWGLAQGASLPPEGALDDPGADAPAGVVDADDDGDPGVTLRGDGEVPTVSWAVRRTRVDFDLTVRDDRVLAGTASSATDERILGGPAGRVLKGRQRTGGAGDALFVRADGLFGSPRLDTDGDRLLTCGELAPYLFDVLPAPDAVGCR